MGARPTPRKGCTAGNFVAEWFGHRVWPTVDQSDVAHKNQSARACPFLTVATGERVECIKKTSGWAEPYGVCTISSDSNGSRESWIACPYRILDQHFALLSTAVRYSYGIAEGEDVLLLPITVLHREQERQRLRASLHTGRRVFVFASQKLGGEIDLPETTDSPGASVDMSVIEVVGLDVTGKPGECGKHLFFEIQTSDFHGSPLHAAEALKRLCPRGGRRAQYHDRLASQVEVCGTGVEGPNKANIFKRTVYQMIYKIELAKRCQCAGFAIVLPTPVWESWKRHLGQPDLKAMDGDPSRRALLAPNEPKPDPRQPSVATIYVFDIDSDSRESPQPLRVVQRISCTAQALSYHAFVVAADKATRNNVVETFRTRFAERIGRAWNGRLGNRPLRT